MSFKEIQVLFNTGLSRHPVVIIAATDSQVLFEYDPAWIADGLELAPSIFRFHRKASALNRDVCPTVCQVTQTDCNAA